MDWEVELGGVIGSPASYIEDGVRAVDVSATAWLMMFRNALFNLDGTGQVGEREERRHLRPDGPWLVILTKS